MAIPLLTYVQQARRDSKKVFLERNADPVLVLEPYMSVGDSMRFETVAAGPIEGAATTVAVLAKRSGSNAFAHMITIGRAGNNDVIIDGAGVSKFHAYLLGQPERAPTIVDARSTYGTFVNGEKIQPGVRVELRSGVPLKIGMIGGTYLDAPGFWEYLREVIADPSRVALGAPPS